MRDARSGSLLCAALAVLCGCRSNGKEGARVDGGASSPGAAIIAGGQSIAAIALKTEIYERPDGKSKVIGYFRLGQSLARADRPSGTDSSCPKGYYEVKPKGFVCHGDNATLDLSHPVIKAFGVKPDITKPMPYTYGFVRRDATLWHFVPNWREMDKWEFAFQGHMKEYAAHAREWNRIDRPGANQVPLDEQGNPTTLPKELPPMPPQPNLAQLFPPIAEGDAWPFWLHPVDPEKKKSVRRSVPNISSFQAPHNSPYRGKIMRYAGVAVLGSFHGGKQAMGRKFVVTLDGRLIAEDKLKPHYASPFHGVNITDKTPLPFAIVKRQNATQYTPSADKGAEKTFRNTKRKVPHREVVLLTGRNIPSYGKFFYETKDGHYLAEDDIAYFAKPPPTERFDHKKHKWIDISITYQSLMLFDGERPVYATLVSTGADGAGDPFKTKSTIRGEFRIQSKHITATMDADDPENRFELRDVPWVQYFEGSFAVHAAYWHDDFGRPRSHGCVNLAPVDARRVFQFTEPVVPAGWHGVQSDGAMPKGTWVRVRK